MKKNDFDNRLQNDLFPEMPLSFGQGLKRAMKQAGVQPKKRPSATGIFTGTISVVAAAAVLLIVLVGVLGGGKGKLNAAAPGDATATAQEAQPAPEQTNHWNGDTKVIPLSVGFEFENQEKYEALYTGILRYLMVEGESEPDELWLCAVKERFAIPDTGYLTDLYLTGYYVLAQHSFVGTDGPELYCLTDEGAVLWCTEGSGLGPNHAIAPQEEASDVRMYQGHFVYGGEPVFPQSGVLHVKRGAMVGLEPGTDIEFSMAASITAVEKTLAAADSRHADWAREFFLVTIPTETWEDEIMKNPILRFETEEGNVDVNMETELPLVQTVLTSPDKEVELVKQVQQQVLAAAETKVLDLTGRTCLTGEPDYAAAILRALETSGVKTPRELWLCAVDPFSENEATFHRRALLLAQYVFEGASGPALFYYEDGRVLWMTDGYDTESINVAVDEAHHFTILFGVSPAYDGRALAMTGATVTIVGDEPRSFSPVLPLDKVQKLVGEGPNYDYAREYFLCSLPNGFEVKGMAVETDQKTFARTGKATVWRPQTVPAMAVESDGMVYPGKVTHLAHALDENDLATDGSPLMETLRGTTFEEIKIVRNRDRALPWEIITASDNVTVDCVEVYSENMERLYNNAEISIIDGLDPGTYYLCFRTTVLGPYSEKIGRYTFRTDYTIYKAVLN